MKGQKDKEDGVGHRKRKKYTVLSVKEKKMGVKDVKEKKKERGKNV